MYSWHSNDAFVLQKQALLICFLDNLGQAPHAISPKQNRINPHLLRQPVTRLLRALVVPRDPLPPISVLRSRAARGKRGRAYSLEKAPLSSDALHCKSPPTRAPI